MASTTNGAKVAGVRAVALVGPAGAGKTSLAEAMLFASGAITRLGSVEAGTTVGDSSPEARARRGSTEINLTRFEYLGDKFAIIDTPGAVGFAADGYAGKWMTEIITAFGGHHEPQEEKVFFEVLKRLGADATMIELGAWWSYYSLWFNKHVDNPKNICGEPDETNLKLGQLNARLNNIQDIDFLQVASGGDDGQEITIRSDSDNTKMIKVKVRTVDSLMEEKSIERLDILHMDVQGFEFDSLHGAEKSITSGKVRFVFVSTHHYIFSKSPTTHADCIKLIQDWGGHIISSHTIHESFSGDGLIVASFFDEDKDFSVSTSLNHTDQALFRSYEQDLGILVESYDKLIG